MLCLLFNAGETPAEFSLPTPAPWRISLDTSYTASGDIFTLGSEPRVPDQAQYGLAPRSLAVLSSG